MKNLKYLFLLLPLILAGCDCGKNRPQSNKPKPTNIAYEDEFVRVVRVKMYNNDIFDGRTELITIYKTNNVIIVPNSSNK